MLQDPRGSDHLPIAILVSLGPQQSTTVEMPYDLTRNIDWKQYAEQDAEAVSIGVELRDGLAPLEEYAYLANSHIDWAARRRLFWRTTGDKICNNLAHDQFFYRDVGPPATRPGVA